jgi:hypothetical protein
LLQLELRRGYVHSVLLLCYGIAYKGFQRESTHTHDFPTKTGVLIGVFLGFFVKQPKQCTTSPSVSGWCSYEVFRTSIVGGSV